MVLFRKEKAFNTPTRILDYKHDCIDTDTCLWLCQKWSRSACISKSGLRSIRQKHNPLCEEIFHRTKFMNLDWTADINEYPTIYKGAWKCRHCRPSVEVSWNRRRPCRRSRQPDRRKEKSARQGSPLLQNPGNLISAIEKPGAKFIGDHRFVQNKTTCRIVNFRFLCWSLRWIRNWFLLP